MGPLVTTLWVLGGLFDAGGHLAFKAAVTTPQAGEGLQRWKRMAARPWLWIGVSCYVLEFFIWTAFLSLLSLSKGVLLGSINIVVLMVAGRMLFGERLTPLRVAGMLLISAGVVVVGAGT